MKLTGMLGVLFQVRELEPNVLGSGRPEWMKGSD